MLGIKDMKHPNIASRFVFSRHLLQPVRDIGIHSKARCVVSYLCHARNAVRPAIAAAEHGFDGIGTGHPSHALAQSRASLHTINMLLRAEA